MNGICGKPAAICRARAPGGGDCEAAHVPFTRQRHRIRGGTSGPAVTQPKKVDATDLEGHWHSTGPGAEVRRLPGRWLGGLH